MVYSFSANVEYQISVLSKLATSVHKIERLKLTAQKSWLVRLRAKLKICFSLKVSLVVVHVNLKIKTEINLKEANERGILYFLSVNDTLCVIKSPLGEFVISVFSSSHLAVNPRTKCYNY